MNFLDANAEGIALALVVGLIGLVLALGAIFIERLVEPRHEREFDNLTRTGRGRQAQARHQQAIPRPSWAPPSGWLHQRGEPQEDLQ